MFDRLANWWFLQKQGLQKLHDEEILILKALHENEKRELKDQKVIIQSLKDKAEKKLMRYEDAAKKVESHTIDLILPSSALLTQKEQMDISEIVNLDSYVSLRSLFLKTSSSLYEQASSSVNEEAKTICRFAKLLKDFVVDMDRMRIEHPDEMTPEIEDSPTGSFPESPYD